jgi:hypothetical protein
MKLLSNWRQVLRYAWSIRWIALAGVLSGLEIALPLLDGLVPIPPRLFAALAGLATAAAFVSRILAQKEFEQ